MKKFFVILATFVCLLTSCGNNDGAASGEPVEQFADEFGQLAAANDIAKIRDLYPEAAQYQSVNMSYNPDAVEIFPEGDGLYTIKYGNGVSIKVREGLNDAFEVVESTGLFNSGIAEAATPAEAAAPDKSEFVANFKKNIKASDWKDDGWGIEDENSGKCHTTVKNKNSVAVDGSDYHIKFKYEYLYEGGPAMHSETVTKKGKNLPASGSASFSHYYTDDCGPLDVKVVFDISDDEIYNKYAR